MVYFITTASLMITVALCVLVGRRGLVILRLEAVGSARGCSAALAGLRTASLYPYRTTGEHHSALFPLPSAVGAIHWGAGTSRSDRPLVAQVHPPGLRLSCRLNDRDLPSKCVWRQSDRGRPASAQRAGSLSHAGRLHSAAANGRLGNPAPPKPLIKTGWRRLTCSSFIH